MTAGVVSICKSLNEAGARYFLIGGFVVIAQGACRTRYEGHRAS